MMNVETAAVLLTERITEPLDRLFAVMHALSTSALKDGDHDDFDFYVLASQFEICAARVEELKDAAFGITQTLHEVAANN